MANFEAMLEESFQNRQVFVNLDEAQRRQFLAKVHDDVQIYEPFGRIYFNINMIRDWNNEKNQMFRMFATGIARFYDAHENLEANPNITDHLFTQLKNMIQKTLDAQENVEEEEVDR